MFKLGDRVIYDGVMYAIEKDHGNGVYDIGDKIAFVQMVSEHMLTPVVSSFGADPDCKPGPMTTSDRGWHPDRDY